MDVNLILECDTLEKKLNDEHEIECSRLQNGRFMKHSEYRDYLLKTIKDSEESLALLTNEEKETRYNCLVHLANFPYSKEGIEVKNCIGGFFSMDEDEKVHIEPYNVKGADKYYDSLHKMIKRVDQILEDYKHKNPILDNDDDKSYVKRQKS